MGVSKVFVIIVTYNGKQWYSRCFENLRSSAIPIQIIVVDNASSDDTVNYINLNFPEVNVIKSAINLGFGQANNLAIKYALNKNADYVFLLNQDAWIEPNTIADLICIHQRNLEYGILSPMHLNVQKNRIEKGLSEFIANYNITSLDLINDMYFNRIQDLYETKYVNAAAWLLPRITLETIGGFDPIFFHYGEDDNYMHRVLFHGLKIGICPRNIIVHDTENQVQRDTHSQQSNLKTLLTEYTNINIPFDLNKNIIFYIRKIIDKIFKVDFKQAHFYLLLLKFILQNKLKIEKSRFQNSLREKSWL